VRPFSCTPRVISTTTAMLYARNRIEFMRMYTSLEPEESLLGREVGMIGFGRIGRALVEMLRGFDIRWRVYDPYAPRELAVGMPVQFDSLNGVLKRSSLLMVTAAATEKTRHLLNRERLGMLEDGAVCDQYRQGQSDRSRCIDAGSKKRSSAMRTGRDRS
jgi:phosphoglycerate dehydrogenase-like enzyme